MLRESSEKKTFDFHPTIKQDDFQPTILPFQPVDVSVITPWHELNKRAPGSFTQRIDNKKNGDMGDGRASTGKTKGRGKRQKRSK